MSGGVEEILAGRSVCVCAGPGGVGKTTTAAAVAAGMAVRGNRVLVLTIDPARRLADSLGLSELSNAETLVDPALFEAAGVGSGAGELWAMMLDAKATFDEVVARHAPDEEARERILGNRIYQQISEALAGSQEYMAMEKLYELHERGDYDLLILDTPPSRDALEFLDAPRRLLQFIEGRSLRLLMRPAGLGMRFAGRGASLVFSILRRLTGFDLLADLSEFFNAMSGMIGGFRERAQRVEALLADERTTFLVVCAAAGPPAEEAIFLRRRLAESGMAFGGAVANRVGVRSGSASPDAELEAELAAAISDRSLRERVAAAYEDALVLSNRDRAGLERLAEALEGDPLITVPQLSGDVHDLAGLLEIDSHLFSGPPRRSR